ncbi:hypothetical protein C2G38_2226866 [Gigaspora rosea]|uniref:Uncharacterized protein n=1 Tax=Gigaspora rosea TaxID=44941 RepID=A0A397U1Y7_9GLOM|nr:hypothetical protein C2G38_2226866 [Gigaspora rosea]
MEINKLSQEFLDQAKKVKELKKEKERLEQATDKIINKEVIIEELKEEYFKRTGRKIEEYGYCTIASDIKEIEPEYLEHEELYKKLDYLHSIIINNIGQYLIKRKETYDTVGELNIYNCYSDNRTWNKLTIARNIFKLQEQVYQPYLGHEIGIKALLKSHSNNTDTVIQMSYNSQSELTSNYRPQYFSHLAITRRIKLKLKYIRPEYLFEQYHLFLVKPEDLGGKAIHEKNENIDETCYSTEEWEAESCLQKEASHIVTLAIYIHPLEEPPKHTEPHNLGPWNLYKIEELLRHRNELIPILEKI